MDVFLNRQKFLGEKKEKKPAKIFQLALAVNVQRRHDVFHS